MAGDWAGERTAVPGEHTVRTFHARTGRLSPAKRRALAELLPGRALRPGDRPSGLDFGCGTGEALVAVAAPDPHRLWLGVDVHRASLATAARRLAALGLDNVRLELGDGVDVVSQRIDVESLHAVLILFPDPWPKSAHRRRRLIQPPFAAVLATRLAPGGVVELATDRLDYARQMLDVLTAHPDLSGGRVPAPHQPRTFYERRAREAGRPVVHLRFVRR